MKTAEGEYVRGAAAAEGGRLLRSQAAAVAGQQGRHQGAGAVVAEGDGGDEAAQAGEGPCGHAAQGARPGWWQKPGGQVAEYAEYEEKRAVGEKSGPAPQGDEGEESGRRDEGCAGGSAARSARQRGARGRPCRERQAQGRHVSEVFHSYSPVFAKVLIIF